jgi:hypothetical protein
LNENFEPYFSQFNMDLNNIEKTKEALKNALEKSPHPFLVQFEGVIRIIADSAVYTWPTVELVASSTTDEDDTQLYEDRIDRFLGFFIQ